MVIGNCPVCGADMRIGTDMTNAYRIRAMTDEELAFYIVNHPKWTDESACVNWLKEEAKDD